MLKSIKSSYLTLLKLLESFINNPENIKKTDTCARLLEETFRTGGKVLVCGNGGSMCDAMHFAEEFTGKFRGDRKPLPVISISDPSHLSCTSNDYGFEEVFSRGVDAFGKKGDILIAISTSGNSENVIRAVNSAKKLSMKTICLLGKDTGKLQNCCDIEFNVDGATTDRIQEIHIAILHIIIEHTERRLFPENY